GMESGPGSLSACSCASCRQRLLRSNRPAATNRRKTPTRTYGSTLKKDATANLEWRYQSMALSVACVNRRMCNAHVHAKHLRRPQLTALGKRYRIRARQDRFSVQSSEEPSCVHTATSPDEVKSVPSIEKEAVVAKSKMAVVAGPESPQDAAQKIISEPGNQAEISALAYVI